jgi:hypothetical protein
MGPKWPVLIAFGLAGCGRIAFDPLGTGDGPTGPGGEGGPGIAGPCPLAFQVPATLRLAGTVDRINYAGASSRENNVVVDALTAVQGTVIATSTTNVTGAFSMNVPTGGMPFLPFLRVTKSGLVTGVYSPDQAIDADATMIAGYITTSGGADSLYAVASLTRNLGKGTLALSVVDCAGVAVSGATISITPSPDAIIYGNNVDGLPSNTATSTPSVGGYAWGLNVPAGIVTVTAAKAGRQFLSHEVEVVNGNTIVATQLRPMP